MKMIKKMMVALVLVASVFAGNAMALKQCPGVKISGISIQSNRDDGSTQQNNLLVGITPVDVCGSTLMVDGGDNYYNQFLSTILFAMQNKSELTIWQNETTNGVGVPEIAIIYLTTPK